MIMSDLEFILLQKGFHNYAIIRKYIQVGLALLESAPNLSKVYGVRRFGLHQLKGGRKGQFALKLHDGKRLVFKPKSDPVPQKDDGGIDEEKITEVTILEIVNYHRKK